MLIEEKGDVGVVGFSAGKLCCYVCPPQPIQCAHVRFVNDNKSNLDYPAIVEMVSRGSEKHPVYQRECYSEMKIPYNGDIEYKRNNQQHPR